ncbi:MAG: hypothetical protein HY786_06475 [Deltaproteobacteria bacterium]|nr:hypothetical protein [Deltaproteobacteria bacterium]
MNERFEVRKDGDLYFDFVLGVPSKKLFTKGMPAIFNKVDIYKDISEIKNRDDYNYILVAELNGIVNNNGGTGKRTMKPYYAWFALFDGKTDKCNLGCYAAGTPLEIAISMKYTLQVLDAKTSEFVTTLSGESSDFARTQEATCNASINNDLTKSIEKTLRDAFNELLKKTESELGPIALAKAQERALPSDLALFVRFSDSGGFFPNNSLDAGEDAEMTVTAKNTGKGTGYATNLEITSDNPKIGFDKNINIGDIPPGETKEIKVLLKAGLDLSDGKAVFTMNLKEKRGYDAKKVVMNIPVAKLEKPKLEIVSTEIEDGNIGLAKGNGNHIVESGETVELTAFVRNSGTGPALGVNLVGSDMTSGVAWLSGHETTFIGTIAPGETAKAKLAFEVPRNFDAKNIAANLRVADVRPIDKAEYKFAQGYSKKSPDLQYAYQIYSKGAKVETITNGGEYEIEVAVSNKGQIAAKNVAISFTPASGLSLSRSRIDIGDLKDGAAAPAQRITLSAPRTFDSS